MRQQLGKRAPKLSPDPAGICRTCGKPLPRQDYAGSPRVYCGDECYPSRLRAKFRGKRVVRMGRAARIDVLIGRLLYPEAPVGRPTTRGQCAGGIRPCPWVSCRHHLFLDVTDAGNLRLSRPGAEVWDLPETCSLDVADRGGETLEAVGELLGFERERCRQVEVAAIEHWRELDDEADR